MNDLATMGVIYVASGARYLAEAGRSCASLKCVMPGVATALYTDTPAGTTGALFDHILPLPSARHNCGDKLIPLLDVPFDRAIFLDSDTYVVRPIDDLFRLLDQFDFAIAHEPCRWGGRGWSSTYPTCPTAFCELNTGVFAFKKGKAWEQLVRQWKAAYERQLLAFPGYIADQPALQEALYDSSLRFFVLPAEYNLRTNYPAYAGDGAEVRVLHGRECDLATLAQRVNRSLDARAFYLTERAFAGPGFSLMLPEKWWFATFRAAIRMMASLKHRLTARLRPRTTIVSR
jgi:hypothetical protein